MEPVEGVDLMRRYRPAPRDERNITNGPGKLCQAFKIDKKLNNVDLTGDILWIEDRGTKISPKNIISTKRIGVEYAGKYKNKPWRFYIQGNKFVSKK